MVARRDTGSRDWKSIGALRRWTLHPGVRDYRFAIIQGSWVALRWTAFSWISAVPHHSLQAPAEKAHYLTDCTPDSLFAEPGWPLTPAVGHRTLGYEFLPAAWIAGGSMDQQGLVDLVCRRVVLCGLEYPLDQWVMAKRHSLPGSAAYAPNVSPIKF